MASTYWMKFYYETMDDPKVARLPDNLWRRFFECCLLAGETHLDGRLPPIADIAWRLRVDEETLQTEFKQLAESGLLEHQVDHVLDEGNWIVLNFAKRQAPLSNSDRVRRHRENQKKDHYYESSNVTSTPGNKVCNGTRNEKATNRYTDIDKDKDADVDVDKDVTSPKRHSDVLDPEVETETESGTAAVFTFFENNLMPITPHIRETIGDALDDYPSSWIMDA